MRFDITPYIDMSPAEVRQRIRKGEITFPTAGMCRGYAQANLVILPPEYAADFEEYTRRNPFPCPVLEIIRGTPKPMRWARAGILPPIFRNISFIATAFFQKRSTMRPPSGKRAMSDS